MRLVKGISRYLTTSLHIPTASASEALRMVWEGRSREDFRGSSKLCHSKVSVLLCYGRVSTWSSVLDAGCHEAIYNRGYSEKAALMRAYRVPCVFFSFNKSPKRDEQDDTPVGGAQERVWNYIYGRNVWSLRVDWRRRLGYADSSLIWER